MSSNLSEKAEMNEEGPLTDEFINTLYTSKKVNNKKKMLEELISYINANPNYIIQEGTIEQFKKFLPKFTLLLNENNNNFISVEISLLNIMSNQFKNSPQFKGFLIEILPKLFDKFNLQNTKINKELIELFNTFIKNNITFKDFVPYIENVSIEDDDNYKSNILEFVFSQIKIDDTFNMKSMPQSVITILEKLVDDEDNEVSNIAFNSLETLNIRSVDADNKTTPVKEKQKEIEKKPIEEEENFVVEKKQKPKEEEEENFVVEKKNKIEEDKTNKEEVKMPKRKSIKIKGRTFRSIKKGNKESGQKESLQSSEIKKTNTNTSSKKNDETPIKVSNKEFTINERSNSKEETKNPEVLEQINKIRQENIQNKYMTYDDRVVGSKSDNNKMFQEEMERLNLKEELNKIKEEKATNIDSNTQNDEDLPIEAKKKSSKIAVNLKKSVIKNDERPIRGAHIDHDSIPLKRHINNDSPMNNQCSISQPFINEDDIMIANTSNEKENQIKALDDFQKKVEMEMKKEQSKQETSTQPEIQNQKTPIKKDDPKFDEIKNILGSEIVQNLDETKWELKKQGFEGINKFIQTSSKGSYKIDDLLSYVKYKLKDFKETNFNLIREAINIFNSLLQMKLLSKDNILMILNAYYEKITDIKLKEQINTLLTNILDIIDPDTVIRTIISKLTKKNNAKILIEYSVIFGKLVEDYDVDDLPIKELTDICKIMAANSNPQVRTAATSLLCILYKWIGNDIKIMIKDIKESTLKIIEAEFEKVTVIEKKDKKPKKEIPKSKDDDSSQKKPKSNELIPRVDISKKITPNLLKDIKDGKWPEKKEACEAIEKIIIDANMKILPNGLNDLFNLIKTKLGDGNKNIVRMSIGLLSKLIESLAGGFKQYSKNIALALLPNLADKMQILREECQMCLEKWVTFVGFDTIVYYVPNYLKTENFDIRTEILSFLNQNKDKFTKPIGETVFKEMVSPLMNCIQDRASSIRASAEDIIIFSQQFISMNLYYKSLKDFKPVIANGLRQTLDRLKQEDDSISTNAPSQIQSSSELPSKEKSPVSDEKRLASSIRVFKKNKHQMSNDNLSPMKSKEKNNSTHLAANSTVLKTNTKNTNSSQLKKLLKNHLQVFANPVTIKSSKEKRFEIDKKFKFNLETLGPDYENKLRDQLKGLFTEDFLKKIFSDEFKSVIEGMNSLKGVIDRKENINLCLDFLDLIFKMIGYKFMSNQNPSMLKSLFEFLDSLVQLLTSNSFVLNDTESNIIIPLLVEKLSLTNSLLKEHVVFLLNNYINIVGTNKATLIMLNTALTKNQKIKSEILDLTTDLYLNDGIDIATRQYARVFAKYLAINDNNVKAKSIALFKEIYAKIGDDLWSYIDLNEKEREFLEEYLYEYEEEQEEAEGEEEEEEEENYGKKVSNFNHNPNYDTNYQNSYLTNTNVNQHKIIVQQHQKASALHNNDTFNTTGSLKSKNELIDILGNLLANDPTERVNTIIIIHELLCPKYEENKSILIANIDMIINTFVEAMNNLFSQKIETIPIKFAKYLATVLCKIASNKELISNISYDVLLKLSEELLSNLLIENLDKIGNNQEGSIIFKSLNSTMLRILENCNSTFVILSLLELIRKYRTNEEKNKLAGLSIKCLLKVNQNLETIISSIEVDKILLQIHVLLVDFEKSNPDLHPKNQTDQVVIKYIKNLINEMVKIKKSKIIDDYTKGVRNHSIQDKYIIVWIKNCLSILQVEALNEGLNPKSIRKK